MVGCCWYLFALEFTCEKDLQWRTFLLPICTLPSNSPSQREIHFFTCLSGYMCISRLFCVCISSVQSLSCVRLFATPWIAARQASLSITSSRSSLRLMSVESVMPSSHLILCRPLLLLPPIPPSIRVFSSILRCSLYFNYTKINSRLNIPFGYFY